MRTHSAILSSVESQFFVGFPNFSGRRGYTWRNSWLLSLGKETRVGRGGPRGSELQAGRLMTAAGHLLEDEMATFHQPGILEKLLAVFMTVGNAGTPGTFSSSGP